MDDLGIEGTQHYLTEDQKQTVNRRLHNALHTVLIEEFEIPEEVIITNTEPNFTHHVHKQDGSYCNACVMVAQDGLTSD
jgi:hypothetical protein